MYRQISKLIIYGDLPSDSILSNIGEIFKCYNEKSVKSDELIKKIYTQIKKCAPPGAQSN